MKTLTLILGCLILAALIALLVRVACKGVPRWSSLRRAFGYPGGVVRCNALGDGVHPSGKVGHLLADAAHAYRHLLVKRGSDAAHFAVATANAAPLGFCTDQPSAAEEPASISLLGAAHGTMLAIGSEAIAADAEVFTAAGGKLQDLPAGAGTYYKVGRAFTACAGDGLPFEIIPCYPVATVVT